MKRLSKAEADEKMELEYIECDCGFHLAVDSTYLLQVGDFKLKCPSCKAIIDTAKVCPEEDTCEPFTPTPQDKPQISLTVTQRTHDWHASTTGVSTQWDRGYTIPSAIGNWVLTHGKDHGIKVEIKEIKE